MVFWSLTKLFSRPAEHLSSCGCKSMSACDVAGSIASTATTTAARPKWNVFMILLPCSSAHRGGNPFRDGSGHYATRGERQCGKAAAVVRWGLELGQGGLPGSAQPRGYERIGLQWKAELSTLAVRSRGNAAASSFAARKAVREATWSATPASSATTRP